MEAPRDRDRERKRRARARMTEAQWNANAERIWAAHLLRRYGITADDYRTLLTAQGGVCAACGEVYEAYTAHGRRKPYHVDHDHSTGHVRALLCHACNTALGSAGDDSRRLRLLADYRDRQP